jgi:hypothetical protein
MSARYPCARLEISLAKTLGKSQLAQALGNVHPLLLVLLGCAHGHSQDEKQKGRERHDERQAEKRQNECESVPTEKDFEKETQ